MKVITREVSIKYSQIFEFQQLTIIDGKLITSKRMIRASKIFENIIIFLILCSSLTLIIDNPLYDPHSTLVRILFYADIVFSIMFLIEAVFKILALGFLWNRIPTVNAYMQNGWNILDFVVVGASLVDLYFTFFAVEQETDLSTLKSLKALRALRALRPLRMVSRNEGLRIVVNALFASIPAMTNVVLVCILIFVIFSVLGINFFKGSFFYCSGLSESILSTIDTKADCLK